MVSHIAGEFKYKKNKINERLAVNIKILFFLFLKERIFNASKIWRNIYIATAIENSSFTAKKSI